MVIIQEEESNKGFSVVESSKNEPIALIDPRLSFIMESPLSENVHSLSLVYVGS